MHIFKAKNIIFQAFLETVGLAILQQLEVWNLNKEAAQIFVSRASDHCASTRRARRPKICCEADVVKSPDFKLLEYIHSSVVHNIFQSRKTTKS
jgi:hypothetical protein